MLTKFQLDNMLEGAATLALMKFKGKKIGRQEAMDETSKYFVDRAVKDGLLTPIKGKGKNATVRFLSEEWIEACEYYKTLKDKKIKP